MAHWATLILSVALCLTGRRMIGMFCASHDTKLRDYFLGLLLDPCFAHRAGNQAAAPE